MSTLLLHEKTQAAIDAFINNPGHALLLTAPPGSGKGALAELIAARLLQVPIGKVASHPNVRIIQPVDTKSISVEAIREAIHFTTLRSITKGNVNRVIIIQGSERMTSQAQNALLKTIEEPPSGTVLILTAADEHAVLPTIRSRVLHIPVLPVAFDAIVTHFTQLNFSEAAVSKAMLMSGGSIGLMFALLHADTTHPLYEATVMAREVLQKSLFERLTLVDTLATKRQLWIDMLFILGQMARTAIRQKPKDAANIIKWQKLSQLVLTTETETASNAQLKLVVLHFMLAV